MTDKVSGATALVAAAATLLEAFATDMRGQPRDVWIENLREVATSILVAQSGMASLVNLFNRVFSAIDSETTSNAALQVAATAARSMADAQDSNREAICRQAIALLPQRTIIFTHSASSTVLRTLLLAREMGREPEVICTESRPMNEGRELASELAAHEIPVTLVVDAGMYLNLRQVGIVFVGGDSLTEQGSRLQAWYGRIGGMLPESERAVLRAGQLRQSVAIRLGRSAYSSTRAERRLARRARINPDSQCVLRSHALVRHFRHRHPGRGTDGRGHPARLSAPASPSRYAAHHHRSP